ncbi:hypothetical protein AB0B12_08200 [Streptomyces sp. NPDC044780]|uniref:hypothetical protein n=1 Tax=unclassified Streptomyces TaxID=2593676 RepID=UPI003408F2AB
MQAAARGVPARCRRQPLSTDVLDRVDEIVAPGVTVNPADNSYGDFELRADQRRR